jgi:TPR repeat protein
MLGVLLASQVHAEQRLALVIGNDDYANVPRLQRSVRDAEAVAAAFKRLGYDVTLVTNVNFAKFAQTVAAFEAKIRPGDRVAFHYSGHGVAIAGRNYLIPIDMTAPEPGQESLVTHLATDAGALVDEIGGRNPKFVFAIIDACRDNPFVTVSRALGNSRGLARVEAQAGEFILFSAGPGEEALDRLGENDHAQTSVFTRILLKYLETPGLTLQDLAKDTQGEVRELARTVNHEQFPDYSDRTEDRPVLNDVVLGTQYANPQPATQSDTTTLESERRKEPADLRAEPSARPVPAPVPALAADEEAWRRISASNDAADFEGFARIFPNSAHRDEAESRARALGAGHASTVAALPPPSNSQPVGVSAGPNDCDRLAAARLDNDKPSGVEGIYFWVLAANPSPAIAACQVKSSEDPSNRRLAFELARALEAAKRYDEAKAIYLKAASLGSGAALTAPGELAVAGTPPPQNYDDAKQWFDKGVAVGDTNSLVDLGLLYERGNGVGRDLAAAKKLYEKAATLGNGAAMRYLGRLYENGIGLARDYTQARDWYTKGADTGDGNAMVYLGLLYSNGLGVTRDYNVAKHWFEKSVELGNPAAMRNLGWLYQKGLGVPQAFAQARQWYQRAARLDSEAAPLLSEPRKQDTEPVTLSESDFEPISVAFSPDGRRIATATGDRRYTDKGSRIAKVWETASGRLLAKLEGHGAAVNDLAFSPDGTRIVTAGADQTAMLWDTESGRLLNTLEGHADMVTSAAFSPDGTRVVTGSYDKSAKVWDASTGHLLSTLVDGEGVLRAMFSPDGSRILTLSDYKAKVWDASSGRLLATVDSTVW